MSGARSRPDVTVLVGSADAGQRSAAATGLRAAVDATVVAAASPEAVLDAVAAGDVDCVALDHDPPAFDGVSALEAVRDRDHRLPVVLAPTDGSERVAADAVAAAVTRYVPATEADRWSAVADAVAACVEDAAAERDAPADRDSEQALRHYERAIHGANDLISAVDTDRRYLFANERYRQYHDVEGVDLTEKRLEDVLDPEKWRRAKPYVERALDGEEVRYRMRRSRATGPDRVLDIRYTPLRDLDTGAVTGTVATMRDITEQQERERQLAVLDRVLRHNLRTELNVVLGHADVLASTADGDAERAAETIVDASEALLHIAEREREIVDVISRADALDDLDVAATVRRVADRLADAHPHATVDVDAPDTCHAVATPQLEDALLELGENAIAHNDAPTPTVTLAVERDDAVTVAVTDDGPGIPDAERPTVGGDSTIEQLYHGSGLGLWLVRWLVTRSNGTLAFDDADPRGTTVTIILQTDPPDATPRNHHDTHR